MSAIIECGTHLTPYACVLQRAEHEVPVLADGQIWIPLTRRVRHLAGKEHGREAHLESIEQTGDDRGAAQPG
jgi:hypothetical protein